MLLALSMESDDGMVLRSAHIYCRGENARLELFAAAPGWYAVMGAGAGAAGQ
jgi:hypothetical protein